MFLLLAFFVIVLALKNRSNQKHANCESGMDWSEKSVAVFFDKALSDCPNRLILNNLILPGLHDVKQTTQVDTLVICSKGIFIVETKSWNGTVYGNDEEEDWIVYYGNGERHRMYNPTWQNQGHLNRVKQLVWKKLLLDEKTIEYNPMVVFFRGDITHVQTKDCFDLMTARSYISDFPNYLDDETIEELKNLFTYYKEHPASTSYEHARHVQEIKRERPDGR